MFILLIGFFYENTNKISLSMIFLKIFVIVSIMIEVWIESSTFLCFTL